MNDSKYSLNYYYIAHNNGKRVYKKEGQWLTAEMAEELKNKGYIVTRKV